MCECFPDGLLGHFDPAEQKAMNGPELIRVAYISEISPNS